MANQDWRFGLIPIKAKGGGGPTEPRAYPLKANSTNLFGQGAVLRWAATGYATLGLATNPTDIIGVAAEPYRGSATDRTTIRVWGPENIFKIQSDEALSTTDIGLNFQLVSNASYNTSSWRSVGELDGDSGSSTATAHTLKILGLSGEIGNAWANTNPNVEVMFQPGVCITDKSTFA